MAPRILAGPERLETGWWDGGEVCRDYYVVRDRAGPARVGLLRAGRAGRLDAAGLVRMNAYAELHCLSNFSFGRGASSARELFERARSCGYSALAITDECSLAGIVRALEASRETGVKLIVGAEFQLEDGPKLVLLCENQAGYTAAVRLITRGRRARGQGHVPAAPRRSGRWPAGHVRACGCPSACPISGTAAGCATTFGDRVPGWRWSCITAPTTRSACASWSALGRQPGVCRWSPPATCTCMCAAGWRCRTR